MRIFASDVLNRVLISKELGILPALRTAGSLGNSSFPSRSIAWDSSMMAVFDWNFPEKSALKGFAWQTLPVGDGGNCVFLSSQPSIIPYCPKQRCEIKIKMALDMRGLQVGAPQYRKTFNLHAADMNSQLCGWLFISMHYSLPVHINSTFLWANVVITRKWTCDVLLGLQGWLGVLAVFFFLESGKTLYHFV